MQLKSIKSLPERLSHYEDGEIILASSSAMNFSLL